MRGASTRRPPAAVALRRASAGIAIACVLAAAPIAGCDLSNPGRPVTPADVNFPIALTFVPSAEAGRVGHLLVANSNFDLRYASGTLQSWSVDEIYAAIAADATCGADEATPCVIPIEADAGGAFLTDEVLIGSQADGIALGSDGRRVYLPIRSGRSPLTWVDFDPQTGTLGCGQATPEGQSIASCDAAHRGTDVAPGAESLVPPTDPVAVAVVAGGLLGLPADAAARTDAIVVPHRSGRASLFVDDRALPRPLFADVITGISNDIVTATTDFEGLVWMTSAATQSARATDRVIALAPIITPEARQLGRLALVRSLRLAGIADGLDTRDMAFDPDVGQDRAWVLARRPESVITIDFQNAGFGFDAAPLGPIFAVASGPSRLRRLEVGGREYLVASCYNAGSLSVLDPELGLVATVAGLAGPFEMAYEPTEERLFVSNFRSSTIAVVDLSPLSTGGSPQVLATLARSDPPSPF